MSYPIPRLSRLVFLREILQNLFPHVVGLLEELGGASSAFWPNYPVYLPSDIMGFEGLVQTSGKLYSLKIIFIQF
jgi:hypothetical protein